MLEIKDLYAGIEGKQILKGLSLSIKPGEVREIRFVADAPGTYCYWGLHHGGGGPEPARHGFAVERCVHRR